MNSGTFLLGVGAQKAGTTWLHDYLSSLPEADFGFVKEYHVFDAIHLDSCRDFQRFLWKDIREATRDKKGEPDFSAHDILWKKAVFYSDQRHYFDYFAGLFASDPSIRLTGDISPPYAGLSSDVFRDIRDNLIQRGMHVKSLYLMRDPVERCWSMVRMDRRNRAALSKRLKFKQSEEQHVRDRFADAGSLLRGQYELTVANLRAAFEEEDLLFLLYEDMMNEETISLITNFLNVPYKTPDFGRRPNGSPKQDMISESLQRDIAEQFRPAYDAAIKLFGYDRIARLWPSLRFLK